MAKPWLTAQCATMLKDPPLPGLGEASGQVTFLKPGPSGYANGTELFRVHRAVWSSLPLTAPSCRHSGRCGGSSQLLGRIRGAHIAQAERADRGGRCRAHPHHRRVRCALRSCDAGRRPGGTPVTVMRRLGWRPVARPQVEIQAHTETGLGATLARSKSFGHTTATERVLV